MNTISITGRLGRDPELRYTQTGKAVTNLSIANTTGFGENKQTHWFTVVCWNAQAEAVTQHLRKGSLVGVEGFLQTRKWKTREEEDRISVEITANRVDFLDPVVAYAERAATAEEDRRMPADDTDIPF